MQLSYEDSRNYVKPLENMHFNFKNKIGMRYFKLEVVDYAGMLPETGKSRWAHWLCKCECGNYTVVQTGNLGRQTKSCGCHLASWNSSVNSNDIADRIFRIESETPYKVISYGDGKYDSKWEFFCEKHGTFSSRCGYVLEGQSCPSCAVTGFKQQSPAYMYLNEISDIDGTVVGYKFGITNGDPLKRMEQLQRGTSFLLTNIVSLHSKNGLEILELENQFRRKFGIKYISKTEMSFGYTETVSPENLEKYLDWFHQQVQ